MKLKPCPFCGDKWLPTIYVEGKETCDGIVGKWTIECYKCDVRMVVRGDKYQAIQAWNRRINEVKG